MIVLWIYRFIRILFSVIRFHKIIQSFKYIVLIYVQSSSLNFYFSMVHPLTMENELLHQIVQEALQEDINFNGIFIAVEQLVQPVNIIPNPREVPRRNENYYEEVIPHYSPDDFWCHFRMSRATFQVRFNLSNFVFNLLLT